MTWCGVCRAVQDSTNGSSSCLWLTRAAQVRETRISGPFAVPYHFAKTHPFFLRLDGDDAPAVIAFAAVTTVRSGEGAEISLRLGLAAIDEPFQVSGTKHRGGSFGLGNIDVLTFARARAVVERSQYSDDAIRRSDVVGKRCLASGAGPLDCPDRARDKSFQKRP